MTKLEHATALLDTLTVKETQGLISVLQARATWGHMNPPENAKKRFAERLKEAFEPKPEVKNGQP